VPSGSGSIMDRGAEELIHLAEGLGVRLPGRLAPVCDVVGVVLRELVEEQGAEEDEVEAEEEDAVVGAGHGRLNLTPVGRMCVGGSVVIPTVLAPPPHGCTIATVVAHVGLEVVWQDRPRHGSEGVLDGDVDAAVCRDELVGVGAARSGD
jgi:hypothetical protein